jgi:hypothetical protein
MSNNLAKYANFSMPSREVELEALDDDVPADEALIFLISKTAEFFEGESGESI